MEGLGDVVIIAGANGSGKTRLKQAIVQTLQGSPVMDMTIEATRSEERDEKYFGSSTLKVEQGSPNEVLNNYINSRKYGTGKYVGSLVQIDSNRDIQTLKYSQVNWLGGDPDDAEAASNFYFSPFPNRWQDFVNYIHQKSAARDKKLADELKKNPKNGELIINKNPDPLKKYKEIFSELLPGKVLLDIDPAQPKEFQYKDEVGQTLSFTSLSSGEQEVIKVIFDVTRKDIKHSVIIVDEPELHLHPTLAFKLVETLKTIGDHTNQFIFLTHSADLISTYYSTGDVYFIDSTQAGSNQAHRLSDLNHSHKEVVQLMGDNLGLFAVGKKLVFVEGEEASIDRLTYHKVAQKYSSEAKFIPVGSVENLLALNAFEEQIRNSIFGVNLYMIRDRDGLSDAQVSEIEASGRIRCLKKRHIENYFLDPEILFKVAEKLYITATDARVSQEYISQKLEEIAQAQIKLNLLQNLKEYLKLNHQFDIPTVKALDTKDLSEVKNEMIANISASLVQLSSDLSEASLKTWMDAEEVRLNSVLSNGEWRNSFQGKTIFSMICGELKADRLKVRQAYVDIALEEKPEVFNDIRVILESFN